MCKDAAVILSLLRFKKTPVEWVVLRDKNYRSLKQWSKCTRNTCGFRRRNHCWFMIKINTIFSTYLMSMEIYDLTKHFTFEEAVVFKFNAVVTFHYRWFSCNWNTYDMKFINQESFSRTGRVYENNFEIYPIGLL